MRNLLSRISIPLVLGIPMLQDAAVAQHEPRVRSTTVKVVKKVARAVARHEPRVRCTIVLPPGVELKPHIKENFERTMTDIQWWYSCQMEGRGYGPKTFALEDDGKGRIRIYTARAPRSPEILPASATHEQVRGKLYPIAIRSAERIFGGPKQPQGDIMAIVWQGIVRKANDEIVWCGSAVPGRWALLSEQQFDYYTIPRGTMAHEIGHAFGLHHTGHKDYRCTQSRCAMNTQGVFWKTIEANFDPTIKDAYGALCEQCARIINQSPLFNVRPCIRPPKNIPREVGMRGTPFGK